MIKNFSIIWDYSIFWITINYRGDFIPNLQPSKFPHPLDSKTYPFKSLLIHNRTIWKVEALRNKTKSPVPRKSKRTPFKILSSSYTWYKWTHQKLIKNREEVKRIPRLLVNVAKTIFLPLDIPLEFSSIFESGRWTRNVDREARGGNGGTISLRRSLNQAKRGVRVRRNGGENGQGEGKVVGTSFESSSDRANRFVLREVDRVKLRPRN